MRRPITIISESARKAAIIAPIIEEESIVLEEQKIEEQIIIEQPQTDEITKQKKTKKS